MSKRQENIEEITELIGKTIESVGYHTIYFTDGSFLEFDSEASAYGSSNHVAIFTE